MYRSSSSETVVIVEPKTDWTVPVLSLKLKEGSPAFEPNSFLRLVPEYERLSRNPTNPKNKSIVVEFKSGTLGSEVAGAMVDLYEEVTKNGGRLYLAVEDPKGQEFLNASGFTNLPGVRWATTLDRALGLAGAAPLEPLVL
jgi:hypothetical protein